ncbi:MAG TPA: hypothetical protein VF945_07825 [Polyangia bacterium]
MKLLAIVAVVAAGLAGCGGGTSFATYCDNFQAEQCAKVFECTNPPPPDPTMWGVSVAQCTAMLKSANCANASSGQPCPGRETYHSDKADACLVDLKAATCDAFNAGFTSSNCASVCS